MKINGVLLCAGRGERLRPLSDEVPKPALPILDVPLGAWPLAALRRAADALVINVSHLGSAISAALGPFGDFELLDEGPAPYGTAGTLAALRDRIDGTLVVHNSEPLTDLDPAALLAAHRAGRSPVTVAAIEVSDAPDFVIDGAQVRFVDRRREGGRGGVAKLGERSPQIERGLAGLRYIGVAALEPEVLGALPPTRPLGLAEAILRPCAEAGLLAIHNHRGYAADVSTPGDYLRASRDLLVGAAPDPPVSLPGRVEGDVYLGPGAEAAAGTLGPRAVLLAGSRVQAGARVERAVVMPGETVSSGARAVDCVWFKGGPAGK